MLHVSPHSKVQCHAIEAEINWQSRVEELPYILTISPVQSDKLYWFNDKYIILNYCADDVFTVWPTHSQDIDLNEELDEQSNEEYFSIVEVIIQKLNRN